MDRQHQRQSIESDRLHLLSQEHNLPPSALTSQAPSVISRKTSQTTLKAKDATPTEELNPTTSSPPLSKTATAARRFTKSEEEYLAALRAWVEEKQYVSLGENTQLTGFYGKKTMDMYIAKPGPNWGRKKRSKSEITPEDLDINGRRKTIAAPEVVKAEQTEEERLPGARRKSIRNWLGKR
jgi:hypothetical protein